MVRRRGPRRAYVGLVLAVGLLAGTAMPAAAKMPYFSVEFEPAQPTANLPFTVVVRLWADGDHTTPADWPFDDLDGLLEARSDGPAAQEIPIVFTRVTPNRYEATLTLGPGRWQIVSFPDTIRSADNVLPPGYPDTIEITIAEPTPDVAVVAVILGTIAAVFAAVATLGGGFAARP